ncbi:hypothetical protein [Paraburkholderia aromaticivorans]|uniref:hypothetical protein n=1 Tax=Paraburkholderia aromaticivorans TaxID=2026199 RepID=UPI0012FE2B11|nr:hypothetical protein [Paraburkholderia aromaticivorans]
MLIDCHDPMGRGRNRRATTMAAIPGNVVVLALALIMPLPVAWMPPWPPAHAG